MKPPIFAILLLILAGCASGPRSDQDQAVPTFDPNYNPNDPGKTWRVPATNAVVATKRPRTELTFTKTPSLATMEALIDAGAVKVKGKSQWVIETNSIESRRAVAAARREGATVTRK